jgi:hypothetical protein
MHSNLYRNSPSRRYDLATTNGIGGAAARLQSRTFGQWASARPSITNRPYPVGALASEPIHVVAPEPDVTTVHPIRAATQALREGVLTIAIFTATIVAILSVKLAIWTPFFHR